MTLAAVSPKLHKCRACRQPYNRITSFQTRCVPCLALLGRKTLQQVQKRRTRDQKAALMTRSDWTKKAQITFNRFIRLRDQHQPCICCGKPLSVGGLTGGGYDAGHYRSTGSAPHLRFHEDNVHAQRKHCNQYASGRAVDYRIRLIQRIGLERVEALEADQEPRKYTIEQLQAIEQFYKSAARELERA